MKPGAGEPGQRPSTGLRPWQNRVQPNHLQTDRRTADQQDISTPHSPPRPDSCRDPLTNLKGPGAPSLTSNLDSTSTCYEPGTWLCAQNYREQNGGGPQPPPPPRTTPSLPPGGLTVSGAPGGPRSGATPPPSCGPSPCTAPLQTLTPRLPLFASPQCVQGSQRACDQQGAAWGSESQQVPTSVQVPSLQLPFRCSIVQPTRMGVGRLY